MRHFLSLSQLPSLESNGAGRFVKRRSRIVASAVLCLLVLAAPESFAADNWYPMSDRSLEVVPGSVLDFSAIPPSGPAGANGWVKIDGNGRLGFAGRASPQRFLCASIVPSPPNGGVPDKAEADRWVTQLKRTGYNLVRFHYVDASLMTNRKGDFDFDPVALDRLRYLMAKLKAAGIYWVVDGLTSENGAYGDVKPNRWVNRYNLKARLYYDPAALEHWKRLVTTLWGSVNPYTGLAPLKDPAMLGMILVNEGGLSFVMNPGGHYPKELNAAFGTWLASRYPDDAALGKAWGRDATGGEHVGRPVEVPDQMRGNGKRARDFAAFVADRETELYRAMEAHVRSLGFKGIVTSYDNWNFNHEDVVRAQLQWVDMHAYQSLPSQFAQPGSTMAQTSILDDAGRYGRILANARQWGKPFTVSEYGQPFWNQWRFESAAWIPALAAFQGWDGICQFAELPVLLKYDEAGTGRRQAMYPFGVGADPIARAGERLAALLFLRGDVQQSRSRVVLDSDPKALFAGGNIWGQIPEQLSRLALVSGTGENSTGSPAGTGSAREVHFQLGQGPGQMEKVRNVALRQGFLLGDDPVAKLRAAGALGAANRTNMPAGLFESDTGQMLFDMAGKKLSITTPRTVALVLRSGSMRTGPVELTNLSSPATVAVGAVDNQAIGTSRRLLVWVLTDAENTGMEFADPGRATLKAIGRFPPRLRPVTGQLAIRSSVPGLKVWAVDQTGRRVAEVPSHFQDGALRFAVDNMAPGFGPVTYFEVADH